MARSRWKKAFWSITLVVFVVAVICGAAWYVYLDHLVSSQFEGRRWTLPAHVYASPLELYAGLQLTQADIKHELERLQYRRVERLERPGTYRQQGARLDVALRPALFADESRPAFILSIQCGAAAIDSLKDSNGQDMPIV